MALKRQITLRNVKGSALTYAEMDQNLSSFFYSASLSGNDLLLHYTGSAALNVPYTPTSITVPLTPIVASVQQLTVAGQNVGDVQYRVNNSTLGANTSFSWDTANNRLGVGTPSPAASLHVTQINSAVQSRLRISTEDSATSNKTAALDIYLGNNFIGSFGKTNASFSDIYTVVGDNTRNAFTTIGTTNVVQTNSTGVGIFASPNNALAVRGVIGVGSDTTSNQGLLGSIGTKVGVGSLPANSTTTGLLVESPNATGTVVSGGHVVVGINTTGTNSKYAFSVIAGAGGVYNTPVLTVTADGKIGINKANPVQALDVVGNTTMTGNINIDGTATVVTTTNSQGLNVKALTVTNTGLVQYATNLMPLGGIIMWGGSVSAIPSGWRLCDGGAVVNGVSIPDLRERFIVGAGGDNGTVRTYQYDRSGATYNDYTFMYYGSLVTNYNQKVNTNSISDNYSEYGSNDAGQVALFGQPTGAYFMYNTDGNYFYYIDYDGKIKKGNAIDVGIRYSTTTTTVNNTTQAQPTDWTGDKYFQPIYGYMNQYGFYHVYQKRYETNGSTPVTTSTTSGYWYWIFDKRAQNYSLVRGIFNGDASIDTLASGVIYKTGMAEGHNYTPFQKYKNPGVPDNDPNYNYQPTEMSGKRIDIGGIVWPYAQGYSVGDKGGFNDIQLTQHTMPQHSHVTARWSGNRGKYDGTGTYIADGLVTQNNTRLSSGVGADGFHENRPPYYALAFIIYTGI